GRRSGAREPDRLRRGRLTDLWRGIRVRLFKDEYGGDRQQDGHDDAHRSEDDAGDRLPAATTPGGESSGTSNGHDSDDDADRREPQEPSDEDAGEADNGQDERQRRHGVVR